jgi:hypothetical protein
MPDGNQKGNAQMSAWRAKPRLERARIGRSGVGLGRVVSDLLEREGRELRGEFA